MTSHSDDFALTSLQYFLPTPASALLFIVFLGPNPLIVIARAASSSASHIRSVARSAVRKPIEYTYIRDTYHEHKMKKNPLNRENRTSLHIACLQRKITQMAAHQRILRIISAKWNNEWRQPKKIMGGNSDCVAFSARIYWIVFEDRCLAIDRAKPEKTGGFDI